MRRQSHSEILDYSADFFSTANIALIDRRRFRNTELSELLRGDVDGSQRDVAIAMGESMYDAMGALLDSTRTGRPSFASIHGKPFWAWLVDHDEEAACFDRAMEGFHVIEAERFLSAYPLPEKAVVRDVGAGNGSLLAAILKRYPMARGIALDLPTTVDRARQNHSAAAHAERLTFVSGDFFEAVPSGSDFYLLRRILHDWDDRDALRILRAVRAACAPSSALLILEMAVADGHARSRGTFLDLTMLTAFGGRERTAGEYRVLLEESGFTVASTTSLGGCTLLEATANVPSAAEQRR